MPSDGERNGSVWNLCKSYDFQHLVGHVPDKHGEGVAVGSGAHVERAKHIGSVTQAGSDLIWHSYMRTTCDANIDILCRVNSAGTGCNLD